MDDDVVKLLLRIHSWLDYWIINNRRYGWSTNNEQQMRARMHEIETVMVERMKNEAQGR